MVSELSGVQFGLKLKIERAGSEFDLKSQV